MIEEAFEQAKPAVYCKVNIPLLKTYWDNYCCVLKFGNVGTEDKPTEWAIQVVRHDRNDNRDFLQYIILEETAVSIIKDFDLKMILPPWDDGNPRRARKYVNRDSSDDWAR